MYGRMTSGECSAATEEWVALGIYRRKDVVLEEDSTDCGYVIGSDEWTCDKWENDGYICDDTTKYVRQQRYVRMCDDCNNCAEQWIATGVYRRTDTVIETNSTDCGYIIPSSSWTCSMWSAATGYICDDGNKYAREQLYGRMCQDCNNCSEAWTALGVYRRTDTVLEYNSTDCGYDPTISGNCEEYRDVGETICDGYDEYKYLRKYVRNCEDCDNCYAGWNRTNIYKRGALIKTNSFNCGYIPADTYTRWEEDEYICDSYNKYVRLRKYISEDNVNWYETSIFKRGDLIEENSEDCGYIYPISGDCTVWYFDGNTICEAVDKYEYLRKMVRNCPDHDCEDCDTEWHTTNVYKRGELLEHNSFDCGYLPIENYYLWRNIGTICDGYDKYERLQKYVSEDGNRWYETQIFKKGQLLEENSADCGYVPPQPPYIYRWVLTENTICADEETPSVHIKFKAEYSDRTLYVKDCDGSLTLTSGDTRPSGYEYNAMISAVIGDCVTSIGDFAFINCTSLTSIDIPNSVTSIGEGTFYQCYGLTSIDIPNSVTSIGNDTFAKCTSLTSIDIPSGVTSIGGAFWNCSGLTSCTIGSGVTSIGGWAFRGCTSLTRLNSDVDGVFNIPSGVTSIGGSAFEYCSGLTSITIPSGVTYIAEHSFASCSGLIGNIDIPSGVTSIGTAAFAGCSGLTGNIDIPSGITNIGNNAFAGCNCLTSITIYATTPPSIGQLTFMSESNWPIYVPAQSVDAYRNSSIAWDGYYYRIQPIPNS